VGRPRIPLPLFRTRNWHLAASRKSTFFAELAPGFLRTSDFAPPVLPWFGVSKPLARCLAFPCQGVGVFLFFLVFWLCFWLGGLWWVCVCVGCGGGVFCWWRGGGVVGCVVWGGFCLLLGFVFLVVGGLFLCGVVGCVGWLFVGGGLFFCVVCFRGFWFFFFFFFCFLGGFFCFLEKRGSGEVPGNLYETPHASRVALPKEVLNHFAFFIGRMFPKSARPTLKALLYTFPFLGGEHVLGVSFSVFPYTFCFFRFAPLSLRFPFPPLMRDSFTVPEHLARKRCSLHPFHSLRKISRLPSPFWLPFLCLSVSFSCSSHAFPSEMCSFVDDRRFLRDHGAPFLRWFDYLCPIRLPPFHERFLSSFFFLSLEAVDTPHLLLPALCDLLLSCLSHRSDLNSFPSLQLLLRVQYLVGDDLRRCSYLSSVDQVFSLFLF